MTVAEHPNATLIRRMYSALFSGDHIPALSKILSADVVWHLPGSHPMSGEHRGQEAVFAAMARFDGSVELELHDVLASDEYAVALLRAKGRCEDKRYDAVEIDIFHIRQGRVTEFWSFSEDQRLTDEFWS